MSLNEDQAIELSKSIALYPEFHLTGFERGKGITQEEAIESARQLGTGLVVAGYVERDGDDFFSSAIVVDGNKGSFNVRKSEPWGRSEGSWLSGSHHPPAPVDLTIGKTLILLCVDAFETRYGARKWAREIWGGMGVEWVIVPSYWEGDIDQYLIKRGVWRLARALGARWMVSDWFHGMRYWWGGVGGRWVAVRVRVVG